MGFFSKAGIGIFSGGIAAYIGTPAEVALIRYDYLPDCSNIQEDVFTRYFILHSMTADGKLPPAERRGYKNVFNALTRIAKEEGVLTLWKVRGLKLDLSFMNVSY